MLKFDLSSRIRISLVNLTIVAIYGVMMRYKIGFEFPYLEQANLQHAHSHFAFYGWVTHTLMTLMIAYLEKNNWTNQSKYYAQLLLANLVCSYGMLASFTFWGYNIVSISFSTLTILVSFLFTIAFINDVKRYLKESTVAKWLIAALVFNLIAALGTFALAYMMATKNLPQHLYLASVYFYLHFHYNGWFFFATLGLGHLYFQDAIPSYKDDKKVFWMFVLSCLPAYFLSALWINLPIWLYIIVVIASIVQFMAWVLTLYNFSKNYSLLKNRSTSIIHYLFILLSLALTLKFMLQLGSVIPFISKLAFGFRPIVIAYLHLVLLAIISLFILTYLMSNKLIPYTKLSIFGILLLALGIYLTEIMLAIHGIASFQYVVIPFTNGILFSLSICMLTGICLLVLNQFRNKKI